MNAGLEYFYQHNLWANLKLLDACAGLTDEQLAAIASGTYGSIIRTLTHLCGAEERYLSRITGQPPEDEIRQGEVRDIAALREHARRSGEGLIAVATSTDPALILRGTFRGEPYALPVIVVLTQAINHATDHRCHIATILTQLGIQPPELDVWAHDEATRVR